MRTSELHIQEHVQLSLHTTFRIGGPARFFCEINTESQLLQAIHFARERKLEIFALGGGSNLLVSDAGFNGLVLHLTMDAPTEQTGSDELIDVTVPAGLDWDAFVFQICQQGINGVECLAGIPGSVGGSPIQNIGAYGQEVSSTISSVRALDLQTLAFVELLREACGFSYRQSIFNSSHRGRYLITQVAFRFDRRTTPNLTYADLAKHFAPQIALGNTPTPLDMYAAVRDIRQSKGMLLVEGEQDCWSAGSFFKNPIVLPTALDHVATVLDLDPATIPHWPARGGLLKLPAAWLLERAGFCKGFVLGEAGISSRHTLALINRGRATAADILALRDLICLEVLRRFNIQLEQEPVQLP